MIETTASVAKTTVSIAATTVETTASVAKTTADIGLKTASTAASVGGAAVSAGSAAVSAGAAARSASAAMITAGVAGATAAASFVKWGIEFSRDATKTEASAPLRVDTTNRFLSNEGIAAVTRECAPLGDRESARLVQGKDEQFMVDINRDQAALARQCAIVSVNNEKG